MNRSSAGAVELRDLIDARELTGLSVLHLVSERSPVRDLALVSDFEDIGAVGPDTVVLLARGAARGGWMISAALRYAWERRACALIVPEQPFTASVIELAKRLEVSLLTTRRDMTRLAIDAAIRIGAARAEVMVRVRAVVDRLADVPGPAQAIALLSDELGGAEVWIESSGARTLASPTPASIDSASQRAPLVRARLGMGAEGPDADSDLLLARVPAQAVVFGEQLLAGAAPSVRALLLEQRLTATRSSLPAISITALTGSASVTSFEEPEAGKTTAWPQAPLDGSFFAVCLLTSEPDRVGALVHQIWLMAFPEAPLARFDGGWIGFLPAEDPSQRTRALERVRSGFVRAAGVPITGGSSRIHRSPAEARYAVREAWLAARLADPRTAAADGPGTDAFVEFESAPLRLLSRLVPLDLAEQLVAALFPRLLADPSAPRLIEAVIGYLSANGSVSTAAARLGLHRNTVQSRLHRAAELDVDLTEPANVLPIHLLFEAVRRNESPFLESDR
ncbi:helix-turn-helix domain-containing protein [Microbacterium sp. NPDC089321]|uniref:helix-turn-helix domain-containing protein n=1 Tax=Microbacterium sp. NPDC089321 TaxID=3155183 RepID=UPI0034159E50